MVTVICEKTGIAFEATSKRTKNHPTIMVVLNEANRYGWYAEAMTALEQGKAAGFTTLEQFQAALNEAEAAYKERRAVQVHAANKEQREREEVRRQRHITNELLRSRGYRWEKTGYSDNDIENDVWNEEGSPSLWELWSPDGHVITVRQAMTELAAQNVKFASEWLAERAK